jgi:hypothetical protein
MHLDISIRAFGWRNHLIGAIKAPGNRFFAMEGIGAKRGITGVSVTDKEDD